MKQTLIRLALCLSLVCHAAAAAAVVTSPFGWRIHPVTGEWHFHTGVDIGYDYGEPVRAMLSGRVVYAAPYGGYGNCVILEHAGGDHTLYAHCSLLAAEYGEEVERFKTIAYVGASGTATGPHLHLEWWHDGVYADPLLLWGQPE